MKVKKGEVMQTVKSTINIPLDTMDQMRELVTTKEFASITEIIKIGIDMVISEKRREWYEAEMKHAWNDDDFRSRTLSCQSELDAIDLGVDEEW